MIASVNMAVCLFIVWKIVTYQRHGSPYKWFPSVMAYIISVGAFWQVLRFAAGHPACDSVIIGNVVIALSLHQYGGNVAKLIGYNLRFSLRDWRL